MLSRWLDPPGTAERKRLRRASLPGIRGGTDLEIGCLWPLVLLFGMAIAVGVLVGMRVQQPSIVGPREAVVVRVIDDGAKDGPAVVSTQIVPLR